MNSKIEALKEEGYNYNEYEVVKNTVLLMDEKGFTGHCFNWYISDDVLIKFVEKGFKYEKDSDIHGKYTVLKWK